MQNERGVTLIIVLIVTILLTLLGLSVTFLSMSEFSMSNDLEHQKIALMVADAAFNQQKESLRAQDINVILAASTTLSQYISYPEPSSGTDAYDYFIRNPLAPLEAMNVNFDDAPMPIGTRSVNGLMTPAGGSMIGNGRYWAKLTDNDDGDSDMTADADGITYLRVMAVNKAGAGQVSTYNVGTVKNSVAILEAKLKRDMTLDLSAPLSLYSPAPPIPANGSNLFAGNAFNIDGYDHPTMTLADLQGGSHPHVTGGDSAGIDVINDDSGGGDGTAARDNIDSQLASNQKNRITGDSTDYGGTPSLRDATQEIRSDTSNPDSTNIFDATYLMNFIEKAARIADFTLPNGTNASGMSFGTDADPKVAYCVGNCTMGGGGSGVGLLIVRGRLNFNANFSYRGLILAVGEGVFDMSGSNIGLLGGLFVAKTIDNGDGTYSYGTPSFTFSGNSNFYYQGSGIRLAYSLLPVKVVTWREITPELEPPF